MQRQGPYYANPVNDSKGNPLPGLPPRTRKPNPVKGPGVAQRIKLAKTAAERSSLLALAKTFEFISPRTRRRIINAGV